MGGVRDQQLVKLGPWPRGINNVADEKRLPKDEFGKAPIALREAENVDLDTAGVPTRRGGQERVYEGTLTHSGWKHDDMEFALFVDNGSLHALSVDVQVTDLLTDVGHQPLSYALIASNVFFSNAAVCGMVTPGQAVRPWATEQPAGVPTLTLVAGYGLEPGQYQIVVTFIDADGRESGCGRAVTIDVPEGYGIRLDNLPQPIGDDIELVRVYMTDNNDDVLRRHTAAEVGITTVFIGSKAAGRKLETQFLRPMPPCSIVRLFNGRVYGAVGNTLIWSESLRYGLYRPSRNQMSFDAPITLIVPVGRDGLLIAAGGFTYWLGGNDPAAFTFDKVYSAGAVPGSDIEVPGTALGGASKEPVTVWLARDGQLVAGNVGKVEPLNQGMAAIDNAERAAPLFRAQNGKQQLVMGLRAPQQQGLAITDTAIAHVIRQA